MKGEQGELRFALFDTALGRCGVAWSDRGFVRLQLPEASEHETIRRLTERHLAVEASPPSWVAGAIAKVVRHLQGASQDFTEVPLDMTGISPFAQRVYAAARAVQPGRTVSYGELASRAGSPRGARAVGRALGENPFVLIVPCHRIVASDGRLVGFSAHGGLATKERLLSIEGLDTGTRETETKELTPELWPALERLFGVRGACGGCWCMAWRVEHAGKRWDEVKGEGAHRMMRSLVLAKKAHGVLAFDGEQPIGWCSFGPRQHFPRLERLEAYRRLDVEGVWSINCFFIPRDYRGRGLSRRLLAAAVAACKRHGAGTVEAYPATLTKAGDKLPAAFAWTGPLAIFEEAGFEVVQASSPSRPLVRLTL